MKLFSSLSKGGFLFVLLCISCQRPKKEEVKVPKAIFIIVDGIPADVIEKLNPPVLGEISKAGGFTRAYVGGGKGMYSETPTISAVGYNSLLTGTWANKHNVWDNNIAAPNYHYWNLFRLAKENNSNLKTAIFSTWEDNRTKLVGEGIKQAGNIVLDYKFDGLEKDTIGFPHISGSNFMQRIDEAVSDEAARVISKDAPDLSWVYLEYTDDMAHQFGDSPQFYEAVVAADRQIGKVWQAIKDREKKFNEDWLMVITTDHGRDAETGHNHGGQSDRERATWIVTNAPQRNEHFKQHPGIVDIFPSICNHLKLPIQDDVFREIDGVPFIGPIDIAELAGNKKGDKISLTWKNFSENGDDNAEIWVSETNNFKEGGHDAYQKVGEVSLQMQRFEFEPKGASAFLKIVVKTSHQFANVWITSNKTL